MRCRQIGCVYLQHGEVGQLVNANELRIHDAPIVERDLDLNSAVNDVIVRDDVSVRRNNDSATDTMLERLRRLGLPGPICPKNCSRPGGKAC